MAGLRSLPPAVQDLIEHGELSEWTHCLHSKAVLMWLFDIARKPGAGSSQTLPDMELMELRELMADRTSAYWRGPRAESLQARYRQLIEGGAT